MKPVIFGKRGHYAACFLGLKNMKVLIFTTLKVVAFGHMECNKSRKWNVKFMTPVQIQETPNKDVIVPATSKHAWVNLLTC